MQADTCDRIIDKQRGPQRRPRDQRERTVSAVGWFVMLLVLLLGMLRVIGPRTGLLVGIVLCVVVMAAAWTLFARCGAIWTQRRTSRP